MFSKFFINRPIFATVLALLIVVAGLVTLNILPVAQFPEITPPTVQVSAVYPGANAETVAQTVGIPIEQQVNGVDGMLYMSSNSSSSGAYSLTITFAVGTDIDMATVQVQNTRDNLQQIVYSNIFSDISVEEIAKRCNRSLTSFKKEFFRIYGTSPHQWLIRQRLIHARLLLISTDKAIAEIGTACAFPNTSHFIKLFRKQYGMTPETYRNRHRGPEELQPTPQAEAAVRETAVSVTA